MRKTFSVLVRKPIEVDLDLERVFDIYLEKDHDVFNEVWNQYEKDSESELFPTKDDVEALVEYEIFDRLAYFISLYFKETNQENPDVVCEGDSFISYTLAESIVDSDWRWFKNELVKVGMKKFGVNEEA